MLDTDQLRTFLAVERARSFTAAAPIVHKTQSAVSMQIKRLEERLGRTLLRRGGRGGAVELTEHGERLLPYARTIVETSREALAAFDDAALSGSVRLGTADDYAERYLPAILAGFSRQNPLVEVSVVCEATFALEERMRAGELDLAIVTHNEAKRVSELLRVEPLRWVTSRRHDVHRDDPLPLALGLQHCSWRRQALARLDREHRAYRLLYSTYSATVISAAVLSGLAVSVLPDSAVRPEMRVLEPSDGFPALSGCEIGIMHGPRENDAVVRALMDHIRHSLEALTASDLPSSGPGEVPIEVLERMSRPDGSRQPRLRPGHVLAS